MIGTRVKILHGMDEFIGKTGTITNDSERDGCIKLYRVRLDSPVMVEGVGEVTDDHWSGNHLRRARPSAGDHALLFGSDDLENV